MKTMTEKQADRIEKALHHMQAFKFRHESCTDKYDAQRNLIGRTHYVDDDTLKYFSSRILRAWMPSTKPENGFTYALIESVQSPNEPAGKNKRAVLFDCFGTVIFQSDFYRKTEQAEKALYTFLNEFDLYAHYKEVIKARINRMRDDATRASKALSGKDSYK